MSGSQLSWQLQMTIMGHRRVPVDEPNLRIRVLPPVLIGDEHLDTLHRLFGIPVIAVEMGGGPHHPLKAIHPREIGDVKVLFNIFDGDAPGIARPREDGFDLGIDPGLLAEVCAMLEVLELLLEIGPPATLGGEPALGDLKMRHPRLIERIEKSAIAARITRRITPFQDGKRNLSAGPGRAATIRDVFAADGAQKLQAGRSAAAPAEITALEPRTQVPILISEHGELAGCGMSDEH